MCGAISFLIFMYRYMNVYRHSPIYGGRKFFFFLHASPNMSFLAIRFIFTVFDNCFSVLVRSVFDGGVKYLVIFKLIVPPFFVTKSYVCIFLIKYNNNVISRVSKSTLK